MNIVIVSLTDWILSKKKKKKTSSMQLLFPNLRNINTKSSKDIWTFQTSVTAVT